MLNLIRADFYKAIHGKVLKVCFLMMTGWIFLCAYAQKATIGIGQKNDSPLAILTQEEHRGKGNDKIWHILTDNFDNPSSKNGWGKIKKKFWKDYAKQVVNGGI